MRFRIIEGHKFLNAEPQRRPFSKGASLSMSASMASFTAEGLLIDRPKTYGLKGILGFIAWAFWILALMAGPVRTSAFSDITPKKEAPAKVAGAVDPSK